jgi:hypothetical protein
MKKALLIGINYVGTSAALKGCYDDIIDIRAVLISKGYDCKILTDVTTDAKYKLPTYNNIIKNLSKLVKNASAGDKLYVHYSGHGSKTIDLSGDERDGTDETICPLDSIGNPGKYIIDDMLYDILVKNLPSGVNLYVVFDSCHSGSAIDLPYRYINGGFYKENDNTPTANVIMISGCKDKQTSADAIMYDKGYPRPNGALTWALLKALSEAPEAATWKKFIKLVRKNIKQYSQIPQISVSKKELINNTIDI